MSDNVADGGVIDLSGLDLTDLLDEVSEPSLASVLERIFAPQEEGGQHGFDANI